ncbi:MAG: hypothetical protein P4L46_25785 [Fimbriimonas sp.]|nr:hypothetical protein [Fimbriimonas sp.]
MFIAGLFVVSSVLSGQVDSGVIPVNHMRASKALAFVQSLGSSDNSREVSLSADDVRGVILAKGDKDGIKDIRSCVQLIDVARRKVSFTVDVESKIDKESYELSAAILNSQEWRTSDTDTGISLAVTPRVNADATVTMALNCQSGHVKLERIVFRLKIGQKVTIGLGDYPSISPITNAKGHSGPASTVYSDPKITFHLKAID